MAKKHNSNTKPGTGPMKPAPSNNAPNGKTGAAPNTVWQPGGMAPNC